MSSESRSIFKNVRVLLLLCVLFFVALNAWQAKSRSTSWEAPLWLVVYPINGDGSEVVNNYIHSLKQRHFEPIETFISSQAKQYGLALKNPLIVKLGPEINELPPMSPTDTGILSIVWWSLKMRYWASTITDEYQGPPVDIKMFVIYFDPDNTRELDHSLGLQKGLLGVVNAYANKILTQYNNTVITHELLHTVGASDKYDFQTNQPIFPQGYADPGLDPLYPQLEAEIMAGKIPVSEHSSDHPESMRDVIINQITALEINWLK